MIAGVIEELVLLLHQGLVGSINCILGAVIVLSGWICVESVFQVIFDMQEVAMSNLLPDVVYT